MLEREFIAFYNTYAERLFRYILWLLRNRAAGEDVLQNVFIKLWHCRTIPSDETQRNRWLYTVTRNACLDYLRKERRFTLFRRDLALNSESSAPPDTGDRFDDHIAQLPELEQSILFLHLKAGYSYREIESILGITENQARVRVCRAIKKLRELAQKEIL